MSSFNGQEMALTPSRKKDEYKRKAEEIQEHPLETLTQKQEHDIIMRMARRHQSDVYTFFYPKFIIIMSFYSYRPTQQKN